LNLGRPVLDKMLTRAGSLAVYAVQASLAV